MKKIAALIVLASCANASTAQNCGAFSFNSTQKLTYESRSFPLTFESDQSMLLGDTKYKVKHSITFNQNIASGKQLPKTTEQFVVAFKKAEDMPDFRYYEASVTGLKNPLNMQYYCMKDTLASLLYGGAIAYVSKADTLGAFFFSMTYYPVNAKVGERVKGSSNVSLIVPDTKQIDRIRQLFYTKRNAFTVSAGEFYQTATNVSGPINGTMYGITLAQPALVLKEEKVTIAGKEYNALVLGTESWTKSMMGKPEMSFLELERKYLQLPDMSKPILKTPSFEAGGKRVWEKKDGESLDMNKYGFMLTYREEWLVAGIGVVKTVTYDGNGAILSISELKKIEG